MAGDPLASGVTPSILVVTVPGLGKSQMGDIEARFRKDPRCRVVSVGDLDGYKANLTKIVYGNVYAPDGLTNVAVIGHSFAAIPILDLISNHRELVDYAAFIDPVSDEDFVSSYPMPANPPPFFWCRRSKVGLETLVGAMIPLNITDAGQPEIVEGSHNELPHKTEVIERLARDILNIN